MRFDHSRVLHISIRHSQATKHADSEESANHDEQARKRRRLLRGH